MSGHATLVYEQARRHGYGHKKALECVADGKVRCWCGCPTPCVGGVQRHVGCLYSVTPERPEGHYSCGELA